MVGRIGLSTLLILGVGLILVCSEVAARGIRPFLSARLLPTTPVSTPNHPDIATEILQTVAVRSNNRSA